MQCFVSPLIVEFLNDGMFDPQPININRIDVYPNRLILIGWGSNTQTSTDHSQYRRPDGHVFVRVEEAPRNCRQINSSPKLSHDDR